MTITAMSAFLYLFVCGDLPALTTYGHTHMPIAPVGWQDMPAFFRFPHRHTMPEPVLYKGQARPKFFGVEGEREGKAAPFVHKRGASPSHHPFMVS